MLIQNTKCECGHQNPIGTVLCESCGKPLFEDAAGAADATLEMRYDGVARRSQKQNPQLVDRVWNFFSSVKIAIYLIVLTLLGAALGTIFQQESTFINMTEDSEFAAYYKETYGTAGAIYHALGLSHTYESWWFRGLLVMIGASLVICSLDRVLPLYRALAKQQIRKHLQFITRQQVIYSGPIAGDEAAWVESFKKQLKRRGYRVHQDGTALLAEKNRFSRWGPYINHIGLILFLLAVLGRSVPAWHMDQYLGLYEGETRQIPNTNYYLKNDDFTLELYDESELASNQKGKAVPKRFETKATMYECVDTCNDPTREPVLKEVAKHPIQVNSPLSYGDLKVYQNSYQQRIRFISVNVTLTDTVTGKAYGTFELRADNPARTYEVGPYTMRLNDYFPDFGLDSESRPMTKTRDPNNPAFAFRIIGTDLMADGETYIYFPMPSEESKGYQKILNDYYVKNGLSSGKFAFKVEKAQSGGKMVNVTFSEYSTYLNIRKDKAMPYIWFGAAISMIGLIMGFYWQHRRVWLRIDDGTLSLGAHTNKNSYGLRADVAWALARTGIEVLPKSLDNRRNLR